MALPAHLSRSHAAVGLSDDLERILALPRRAPVDLSPGSARAAALVEVMTSRLRRPDRPPGAPCGCAAMGRPCIDRLLPSQAWALWEAALTNGGRGGLLAPIGVGSGKTLLDILVAMVVPDCKTAVLLVPPGLVDQLAAEYAAIREHFRVPSLIMPLGRLGGGLVPGAPSVHVVPYSKLCRPESSNLLSMMKPDLFIADEVHRLKNPEASQTNRFVKFFVANLDARLCGWSGTITKDSIKDFAHLAAFALGEGSPVPIDTDVVDQWAGHLDPSDWPAPPGELVRFVQGDETPLEAVGRRIRETFGVVSTGKKASCDATNIFRERKPPAMPARLREMIKQVRATWERPDGEEFLDAMAVERCALQLASGFYYRWRFPGNPPREQIDAWFAARKAWGREMRAKLQRGEVHLDSEKLLANAAERAWREGGYRCAPTCRGEKCDLVGHLPTWKAESWPRWRDLKSTIKHETEAVWVDDYLARDAAAWATERRGIVWCDFTAFGHRVAELAGLPYHGGGPNAEALILSEKGDRSIIASIDSHGEGRNGLQYLFDEQIVTAPPPSGKKWEQLLGRLARQGQEADEIVTWVFRHVPEFRDAVDRAIREAKYVEGLLSANQMLLAATVEWPL